MDHEDRPFESERATLYVVATPIGNLRDITLRALDVLKSVDCVAAEDTRVSSGLLRRYGITTKLISIHEHNERTQSARVIAMLGEGQSVALISDAGTPSVSDPGAVVVAAVRGAGHSVVPIPGPSALATLLSVTGWPATPFTFIGFLPAKKGARREILGAMTGSHPAMVFYEAPHRIVEMLEDVAATFDGARRITVGRELTKRFESIHESTLAEIVEWIQADPDRQRGEFSLIVEGAPPQRDASGLTTDDVGMLERLMRELPASRAAKVAADLSGKPRSEFYRLALERSGNDGDTAEPEET